MEETTRYAKQMAALANLGFNRAVDTTVETEINPVEGGRYKVICARPSMGTLVSVTAIHNSIDLVQESAGRAFDEMDRVVDLLNRYDPTSALTFLNREGTIQGPPPELTSVLSQALFYHGVSGGAFDPTVQPLVDLFRRGDVAAGELLQAMSLVDAQRVKLAPKSIRLSKPGMGVTLDGIAKGYVVDCMVEVLLDRGLKDFIVDAGGDIRTCGRREDGEPWRVGVQDPAKEGHLPDVIAMSGMAVATSGSYEIYFDPERTHHHIIDAESGSSPQLNQSVSVIAPSTLEADALATSVFVMEPGAGVTFIDSIAGCACLILDQEGNRLTSSRWHSAADSPPPKAGTK